jgi:hypothetical protein
MPIASAAPAVAAPGAPLAACPSRQARRAAARQAAARARRQALHPGLARPAPAPAARLGPTDAAPDRPVYEALVDWLDRCLAGQGHARPTRTRLALLVAGLVAGADGPGTPHAVARTAFDLRVGAATREESVARRVARTLDAPQLDPHRLLPDLTRAALPALLAEAALAHDSAVGARPAHAAPGGHHGRWRGVRLVVDETTKTDQTHVLAVGLAYRGAVVPLGVRTWPQNVPQPEGAYWSALGGLLWEVHAALPPALRPHVLVLADRGYGVPAFLDLLAALGWHYVVRVQGQVRVLLPGGASRPLRDLAPRPGTTWLGAAVGGAAPGAAPGPDPIVGVFKKAGGRAAQVVAVWAPGQAEPWLLVTSLPATPARALDYAGRWAIERLFLSWKSAGWDLERCGVPDPARLARLLVGYVVATWWLLAAALPAAQAHLAELAARAARRTGRPPAWTGQLRLPLPLVRPWIAKFSLLTLGRRAFRRTPCRTATPALCWRFPDWHAPVWSAQCLDVYHARTA